MQLEIPIVGQTDAPYATRDMVQRKTFYAVGLIWVFYSNGVDGVYRVSTDGLAWSEEAVFKEGCGDGREFSTFFDGRYVHFVYAKNLSGEPMLYWRGEPRRDGVIEWSAPEQLVNQEAGYRYQIPNVCVDSEGYPWITCGRRSGYNAYGRIYRSSVKDGLWETDPELVTPYSVNITDGYALPIPLKNGGMYFLNAYNYLQGFLWDGEKWGDREYLYGLECRYSTALGYNGDVHFAYKDDENNIVYRRRIAGIGWTGPISIFPASVTTYPSLTLDPLKGDLYCLWIGAPRPNGLYYSRYDAKTERWDDWPTEFMEVPLSTDKRSLNTYRKLNKMLGIIYRAGYDVPYEVCFSSLSFVPTVDPILMLIPATIGAILGLVVVGRS